MSFTFTKQIGSSILQGIQSQKTQWERRQSSKEKKQQKDQSVPAIMMHFGLQVIFKKYPEMEMADEFMSTNCA